jgi:hypothetical protein
MAAERPAPAGPLQPLVICLFTPHRADGINPPNGLPTKGLSSEGRRGISTLNGRGLGVEVEDHVGVPISIYILQGRLDGSQLGAGCTKEHSARVYGGGVEGVGRQDGHRDYPFALQVNAVRETAGLNVDFNGYRL